MTVGLDGVVTNLRYSPRFEVLMFNEALRPVTPLASNRKFVSGQYVRIGGSKDQLQGGAARKVIFPFACLH